MLDGLYASSVDGMTSVGKAEIFTSDGLCVSGGGCMTHVTGNTQPITSVTYACAIFCSRISCLKFSQCDACDRKIIIKFLSSAPWNRLSTFPNHRSGKNLCSLSCSILRERFSYSYRQSFRQCLRYGENRRRGESSACNSGPSSDRGGVYSTDQGSGSSTHNKADC